MKRVNGPKSFLSNFWAINIGHVAIVLTGLFSAGGVYVSFKRDILDATRQEAEFEKQTGEHRLADITMVERVRLEDRQSIEKLIGALKANRDEQMKSLEFRVSALEVDRQLMARLSTDVSSLKASVEAKLDNQRDAISEIRSRISGK